MAEVYGEKPKKFTREWWPYFWLYYKGYVIAALTACFFLAVGIAQCAKSEKYDLLAVYSGSRAVSEEDVDKIEELMSDYVEDLDENGENKVFLEQLNITDNKEDIQYNTAMQTKLLLEMQSSEVFLYITDKEQTSKILDNPEVAGAFVPVSEWAEEMPAEELLYSADGVSRAVSLKGSTLFSDNGLKCDDLYVFIQENADDKSRAIYESCIKIANALIK